MITQDHINNFSLTLTKILHQEIESGNEIIETSKGWPYENAIIIFLKRPFINNYKYENVVYRHIDDPHYWNAEYMDLLTKHILVCKNQPHNSV